MGRKDIYLRIVWEQLPAGVHGASGKDPAGGFIVLLNENETQEEQEKAAVHELFHVLRGDHDKTGPIEKVEQEAERLTQELLNGEALCK